MATSHQALIWTMKTAGRAADDHLEMGCAATGPATVGEQAVSLSVRV